MSDRKYLRPQTQVFLVDQCVGKPVEMVEAKPMFSARSTLLVLNDQIADAFIFR